MFANPSRLIALMRWWGIKGDTDVAIIPLLWRGGFLDTPRHHSPRRLRGPPPRWGGIKGDADVVIDAGGRC